MKSFLFVLSMLFASVASAGDCHLGINPGFQDNHPGGVGFIHVKLGEGCEPSTLVPSAPQGVHVVFALADVEPGQWTYLFYQLDDKIPLGQKLIFVHAKDGFSSAVVNVK